MRQVITLIFMLYATMLHSAALANGTSDCIKISDGKMDNPRSEHAILG